MFSTKELEEIFAEAAVRHRAAVDAGPRWRGHDASEYKYECDCNRRFRNLDALSRCQSNGHNG